MMHGPRIVLTQGVKQYRETVPELVRGTDSVLEVGCGTGKTTKIISAHAGFVLAIDHSVRVYEARHHGLTNARIERWNAWDVPRIRSVATRFDLIYVDISGCCPPEILMRLVRCYEGAFEPAVIVVKNTRLKRFVAQCDVGGISSRHDEHTRKPTS
jgi:protein-L-isoaspartate O-methyltransferase